MAVKTVNLPDRTWELLEVLAADENRSRSNMLDVLVQEALWGRQNGSRLAPAVRPPASSPFRGPDPKGGAR